MNLFAGWNATQHLAFSQQQSTYASQGTLNNLLIAAIIILCMISAIFIALGMVVHRRKLIFMHKQGESIVC